jgi:carboxyl-terminal processing protease
MILKLPDFLFDEEKVNGWIGRARKHQALILDLRGNPGGSVDSLKELLGYFFEDSVKIADRVSRKERKPETTKSTGRRAYTGKLTVLVDSDSASAAELFARVVQLEKRGLVMGDRSSGSVMEARRYDYSLGEGTVVFYGASITDSDLIMSDGKSLEHAGVVPDEVALPAAADLAAGRDPVLAHAAAALGVSLSPEEAGKLFPYEWPQN